MTKPDVKPFAIPKLLVWEAWRQVKANKGAPGVDGQDLDSFEADLRDNLYKIWNRMSSGTYFPPPVRAVEIPKPHAEVGLTVHPEKTRIVYCKDGKRRGDHEHISLTFLGYTFRARKAINSKTGETFTRFLPAISRDALKKISGEVRSWRLHRKVSYTFTGLAAMINPVVAGWMQYYGRFRRSALSPLLARINAYLVRWIRKKYRRLQGAHKAHRKLREITGRYPRLFAHWQWVPSAWM